MHKVWLVLQAIKQFQFQYKRFWSFFCFNWIDQFISYSGGLIESCPWPGIFYSLFFAKLSLIICQPYSQHDYITTNWSVKGAIKVKIFNNYNNLKPITKANRDPNKGKLHATNSRVPSLRSSKQKLSFWTSVWPALDVGISWGQSLVLSKGVELKSGAFKAL